MQSDDHIYGFLKGGGEMGERMRAHDWAASPLGPIETWPQRLKTATAILLRSPVPIVMLWGEDGVMIYNDAYSVFAGGRHPQLLGSKVREGWPEVADFNDNVMKVGLAGGTLAYKNQDLILYRTGAPERVWMNLDYSPVLDERGEPAGVIAIVIETTEQVRAEAALRDSEARLRFLDRLGQETARSLDADSILATTCQMVGEHLGVSVCAYADMDEDEDGFTIRGDWAAPGSQSIVGHYKLADFGKMAMENLHARRPLVINDIRAELPPEEAATFQAIGLGATICMPFVKEGRLTALMAIHDREPRVWTQQELALITEVTERSWAHIERVRAQAELRASEERQGLLVRLSDALRPLQDPAQIQLEAARLLGEHLAAQRVGYGEVDAAEQRFFTTEHNWTDGTVPPHRGVHDLAGFGPAVLEAMRAGETVALADAQSDPRTATPGVREAFQALEIRSAICASLVKDGRLTAVLYVHATEVRRWSEAERRLVEEVAERTWAAVERASAEAAVRDGELRYRTLFEAMDEGFCLLEVLFDDTGRAVDYRFLETNPAFTRQTGLENPVGRTVLEMQPDIEPHWMDTYGHVALTGEPARFERGSEALGRYYDVYALRVGDPWQRRVAVLFNDISERRRADLALRELNDQLEARVAEALAERRILADIVEGAEAMVQVVDNDFRIVAINRASADEFEQLYGKRPAVGDRFIDLLADNPEQQAAVRAIWSRALTEEAFTDIAAFGDPRRAERTYELRFSPLLDAQGRRIGAYQFTYDVTERLAEQARLREAEEALRQSQKMETIGQLTGGVAHDFNNLLTPIVGALDMLRRRMTGDERAMRLTDGALQAADRARTLVQRLLAFSRRQHLQPRPVDVSALIHGMSDLVSRSLGPRVALTVQAPPDLPAVQVDPNQLELALLNLAVNAHDAMPDGGALTIEAYVDAEATPHSLAPGRYVAIAVSDTGEGMSPQVLARAVEPFFTTKGVGRGTGLGLSSVHGLAVQSGGAFVLDSQPGRGTRAVLWLPEAEGAAEAAPESAAEPTAQVAPATVLLVDDEELVRAGAAAMLEDAGYRVRQAGSAADALALIEDGLAFDLLVTDYAMPGMTGAQLAQRVLDLRPGAPVLMITGYADLTDQDLGGLPRLAKPFRQADLAAVLADLLAGSPP